MRYILTLLIFVLLMVAFVSATTQTTSFFFNTSILGSISLQYPSVVRSSSVVFEIVTDRMVLCKYSQNYELDYQFMEGTFDLNFGNIHKKTIIGLSDGSRTYYVGCRNSSDTSNNVLVATFNVITPPTAQITLSDESPISSSFITINLVTSKIVQSVPSLSYSFNGVNYNSISLSGSGTSWQGYLLMPVSVGQAVGSFIFNGYDLEGYLGNEITLGAVFLVDRIKPATIVDFDATSYKGRVELDWRAPEDDIAKYKIYRSSHSGIGYGDFYKEVTADFYTDTFVEDGKTYYYRLSAVDGADNEGELSVEIQATALIDAVSFQSGLAPELHGLVDSTLSVASNLLSDIQRADFIAKQSEDERELFSKMGLEDDLDSAKSELSALSEDIRKYKSQSITRTELVSKINVAELRINSVKKKIPEDIIILEKEEIVGSVGEDDIQRTILEIEPNIEDSVLYDKTKKSYDSVSEFSFDSAYVLYHIEIVYLDGTRSKKSIIQTQISSELNENLNFSIISKIPKEIVESSSEIDIRTGGYEILKEDPILAYNLQTKEIFYVFNKIIDKASLNGVKTFLLYEQAPIKKAKPITGYFAFIRTEGAEYYGLYLGAIIVLALGCYLYFLRGNFSIRISLQNIRALIDEAHSVFAKDGRDSARKVYESISKEYRKLSIRSREEVYREIEDLIKILNG